MDVLPTTGREVVQYAHLGVRDETIDEMAADEARATRDQGCRVRESNHDASTGGSYHSQFSRYYSMNAATPSWIV